MGPGTGATLGPPEATLPVQSAKIEQDVSLRFTEKNTLLPFHELEEKPVKLATLNDSVDPQPKKQLKKPSMASENCPNGVCVELPPTEIHRSKNCR